MAAASSTPMGILASQAAEPVGWCACGPRSRYVAATAPRNKIMRNRARDEDEIVWLLPCFFVRAGRRGQGVIHALICAAVELARGKGASAIEGWPLAGSERRSGDAFVGREQVFEDLGFSCVERPSLRTCDHATRAVSTTVILQRPQAFARSVVSARGHQH